MCLGVGLGDRIYSLYYINMMCVLRCLFVSSFMSLLELCIIIRFINNGITEVYFKSLTLCVPGCACSDSVCYHWLGTAICGESPSGSFNPVHRHVPNHSPGLHSKHGLRSNGGISAVCQ